MVLLPACSAEKRLFETHEVSSQSQAGTTHISVLAVAPWADYVDALQPKFELTSEAALGKTLPTSLLLSNQLLSAMAGSLRVSLPTISDARTDSSVRESTGGTLTTDTRKVTEERRAELGKLPEEAPAAGGGRTAAVLPALKINEGATQKEPVLQYQTALALYQEVQLLNSYVRNAAKRSDYIPYIIRLQVTVLPFARNQPYDVYADIAFTPPLPPLKRERSPIETPTKTAPTAKPADPADTIPGVPDNIRKSYKAAKAKNLEVETPIIVPLLVTDTAELSLQSRAMEIVQQLSGALSGQLYNVGVSGNLSGLRDEIAAALGNDVNALSTVGQLKGNVARVRLGAAYQASSKYTMLPRANTVTVLVLVPGEGTVGYDPRFLSIHLRTRLRDARTGKLLPDEATSDQRHYENRIADIAEDFQIPEQSITCDDKPRVTSAGDVVKDLAAKVDLANYHGFLDILDCIKYNGPTGSLWLDLSDLQAGFGYATTDVELPRQVLPRLPERQLALLSDDTSSNATVRLTGGKGLIADQVRAAVVLPERSTGKSRQLDAQSVTQGGERRLPAQSVSKSGDDLVLSFPSLAAWKLVADKGGKPASDGIKIQVSLPDHRMKLDGECEETPRGEAQAGSKGSCKQIYDVAYVAKAAKTLDPGFSAIAPVRTVTIGEKGTGSYRFALNLRGAKKVLLRGDGVVVNKVDPALLVANDYAWQLATSGLITVTLDQLTPGQQFKLILTGTEDRTQEIPIEAKKLTADDKKPEGGK